MGRFVRISSERSINVAPPLYRVDATNKDSQAPDRLNVRQMWTKMCVMIKKGVGYYPSQIKEWETVKSLQERNIITIGSETDTCENQEEVEKVCARLEGAMQRYEATAKQFAPKKTKKTEE